MKAKCPRCENGCDKCQGGFIEVQFAKGKIWHKVCLDCDATAGGSVQEPGAPMPTIHPSSVCPGCGGKRLALEGA